MKFLVFSDENNQTYNKNIESMRIKKKIKRLYLKIGKTHTICFRDEAHPSDSCNCQNNVVNAFPAMLPQSMI